MPGRHAPDKLAARRQRARDRCYLQRRSAAERSIVVKPCIGERSFRKAEAVFKRRNMADTDAENHDFDNAAIVDPFSLHDPWAEAASCLPKRSPPLPSRSESPVQEPQNMKRDLPFTQPFDVQAPHFYPCPMCAWQAGSCTQLDELVCRQNETIAALVRSLEALNASKGCLAAPTATPESCSECDAKFNKLQFDVQQLAKSLPVVVDASIEKRLPIGSANTVTPTHACGKCDGSTKEELLAQVDSKVKDMSVLMWARLPGLIADAIRTHLDAFNKVIVSRTCELLKEYDRTVQQRLDTISHDMEMLVAGAVGQAPASPMSGVDEFAPDDLLLAQATVCPNQRIAVAAVSKKHRAITEWLLVNDSLLDWADPELSSDPPSLPDNTCDPSETLPSIESERSPSDDQLATSIAAANQQPL